MLDYRQILIQLPRRTKTVAMLVIDGATLAAAYMLLVLLRYGIAIRDTKIDVVLGFVSVVGTLALLLVFGFYRWQVRFISLRVLRELLFALMGGAVLLFITSLIIEHKYAPLASIAFVALGLSGLLGIRAFGQALLGNDMLGSEAVIIYGAGNAGRQLAQALFQSGNKRPVAFVDDNPYAQNTIVLGLNVFAFEHIDMLLKKYKKKVAHVSLCVAMPSMDAISRRKLLQKLEEFPIHIQMLSHQLSDQPTNGDITQYIQDIKIEDLLGREAIAPNQQLMRKQITQKVVLVTGAGGSIGGELVRQIIDYAPSKIILLDHCEFALYQIEQQVFQLQPNLQRKAYLASVLDKSLLNYIFKEEHIDTVFHAAAYKHVSLVEGNVLAGVYNNVFGTKYLVDVVLDYQVSNFVLISTDKAVRPTSIMGASKRLAELVVQAAAKRSSTSNSDTTKVIQPIFSMVRFGNVLGSSGSVVPIFQKQIMEGGPVTVRDPKVTRYFMTIPEAAQLVIQSSSLAQGGDVFLLDMGAPVVISDLAKRMIHLMGYRLRSEDKHGIDIVYTHLMAGEKVAEELLIGGDQCSENTSHPKIFRAVERALDPAQLEAILQQLTTLMDLRDIDNIYSFFKQLEIGFNPQSTQ